MTASLTMQASAVEHLLAMHEDKAATVYEAAKDTARTLRWIEKHQSLVKAIADLHRRNPELAVLLTAVPSSQIGDVRDTYEDAAE